MLKNDDGKECLFTGDFYSKSKRSPLCAKTLSFQGNLYSCTANFKLRVNWAPNNHPVALDIHHYFNPTNRMRSSCAKPDGILVNQVSRITLGIFGLAYDARLAESWTVKSICSTQHLCVFTLGCDIRVILTHPVHL